MDRTRDHTKYTEYTTAYSLQISNQDKKKTEHGCPEPLPNQSIIIMIDRMVKHRHNLDSQRRKTDPLPAPYAHDPYSPRRRISCRIDFRLTMQSESCWIELRKKGNGLIHNAGVGAITV